MISGFLKLFKICAVQSNNPYEEALRQFRKENYVTSLEYCEKALHAPSKYYSKKNIYFLIGRNYEEIGENEKYLEAFKKAVECAPNDLESIKNLGIAYRVNDRFEEAEECYLNVLKNNPNDPGTLTSLGVIYLLQGEHDNAVNILEKAVSLDSKQGLNHGNLALAYASVGLFEKAEESLRKSILYGYHNALEIKRRIEELKMIDNERNIL